MPSSIEWTNETWNPLAGCTPVSAGCKNCYAAKEAVRLAGNPNEKIATKYAGTAEMRGAGARRRAVFTGRVNLDKAALVKPLRWKEPRRVFVNSMSDLFHESVPFDFIDQVFATMALARQHTFQVLTKRPERMAEYLADPRGPVHVGLAAFGLVLDNPGKGWGEGVMLTGEGDEAGRLKVWPLPHVWLGTSVEDQKAADERIPHLLRAPAAVRFLSCEPLLGPVDLTAIERWRDEPLSALEEQVGWVERPRIDWVIAGGESGPAARPMHPDWARSLRDQCSVAGVPFFFKQWGAWGEVDFDEDNPATAPAGQWLNLAGGQGFHGEALVRVQRRGKRAAGRELDGRTWDEFPQVAR